MSDVTNPLNSLSYTNKDFESIYVELLDLVKQLSARWDPSISNESDPGVILLKLNALIADKCNYNIDNSVLECFPATVSQLPNARQLYAQLGYYMAWYKGATTAVSLKYIGSSTDISAYTIPKFTMVTSSDSSVIYTLVGPDTLADSGSLSVGDILLRTDGTIVSAGAIQGIAVNYDINGETAITVANLDSNNRLYFSDNTIAQNGIFITNVDNTNYSSWIRSDNLFVEEPGNTFYRFGVTDDGNYCYLEFPDDADVVFKSGINITYIKSQGASGNVSAQELDQFYYTFAPAEDSSITLSLTNVNITNPYAATNGEDPETIEAGYSGYQKTVGTFNTLVTLRDYINYILRSDLVSNGFVCDRTTDLQSTYNIMSLNDGIVTTVHVIDANAQPGYYSSGTFYKGKVPLTTPLYYDAYTPTVGIIYQDLDTGKFYEYDSADTAYVDTVEEPYFDAFSLSLYLLQYVADVDSSASCDMTFNMLTDVAQAAVKSYVEDTKSVQHDFLNLLSPTSTSSHFCFFKNKYPISCKVTTQYALSTTASDEVLANIKSALYANFNAAQVTFGEEISSDDVYSVIQNADSRIKTVSLGNIEYQTYAVYYDTDSSSTNPFTEVLISGDQEDTVTVTQDVSDDFEAVVDPAIFMSYMGETNYTPVTFNYVSPNWVIGDTSVTLSDYGVYFQYVENVTATAGQTIFLITGGSGGLSRVISVHRNGVLVSPALYYIDPTNDQIIFYTGVAASDIIKLTYWSTVATVTGSDKYITARISYATQFRDEIYTKSILAGNTPLMQSGSDFDLRYNQQHSTYTPKVDNISHIRSNVDIAFSNNSTAYTLRDNESLQFFAPNLLDETSYANYVKFEFHVASGSKTIAANANYQLLANEYILFYWKTSGDADAVYEYAGYGPGNIICPTTAISSSTTAVGSSLEAQMNASNNYRTSSDTDGPMSVTLSANILAQLNGSQNVLSGIKTVTIKSINSVTLTASEGYYCYWIRNEPTDDLAYYAIATNTNVILDTGEYFIYANKSLANLSILGAGTQVYITDLVNSEWTVPVVDTRLVLNLGASALTNYWREILSDTTVALTETQFITVTQGCTVTLDNTGTWTRTFSRTGITGGTLTGFTIRYQLPGSTAYITLPQMQLNDSSGDPVTWDGQSLLSLDITPSSVQHLLANQSVQYQLVGNTDFETAVTGSNYTANTYPVSLLTSFNLSTDGSSDSLSTYTVDDYGVRTYLSLYIFKESNELTETGFSRVFTDTDMTIRMDAGVDSATVLTMLPAGEYVLTFDHSVVETGTLTISTNVSGSTVALSPLNSSITNLVDKRSYYLYLNVESDSASDYTITITRSDTTSAVSYTLTNPYMYTMQDGMSREYFDRLLSLIARFDTDNVFDYTYEISEDDLVTDPLDPLAFLNTNFLYNQFTICQLDTGSNTTLYVAGKR